MSLLGLLAALGLSLVALAIVARPLLRPARRQRMATGSLGQQRDRVETYYERVLTNIRDLDEDFATSKINEDDYQAEREAWAQRGIQLLQLRDQLDLEVDSALEDTDGEQIDRTIEAAVAAYREQLQAGRSGAAAGEQN